MFCYLMSPVGGLDRAMAAGIARFPHHYSISCHTVEEPPLCTGMHPRSAG